MPPQPTIQTLGIDQLAVADRFRLLDEIWLSIAAEKEFVIPPWHQTLLDERLAEFDDDPEEGASWEEVEARLRDQP